MSKSPRIRKPYRKQETAKQEEKRLKQEEQKAWLARRKIAMAGGPFFW